jgi:hypothetical protein
LAGFEARNIILLPNLTGIHLLGVEDMGIAGHHLPRSEPEVTKALRGSEVEAS